MQVHAVAHPRMGQPSGFSPLAETEEKEKKRVGMGGKHSPLIPGPRKGVLQGTSGMP